MEKTKLLISAIRLIPHIFLFYFHKKKAIIVYDVVRWLDAINKKDNYFFGFLFLMTYKPEFRNLFYKRVGKFSKIISFLCPQMNTLFIVTKNVGKGLFIQHGFSTIITCHSIGDNCWVNQQVTIGYSGRFCPVIGDNVVINAGAKVIGNVVVGNNTIIGANAVVVKNVPPNCTVVGVPAYIIKRDGKKVYEKL